LKKIEYFDVSLQVLVPKNKELLGKMVEVCITSTGKHFLMGELVQSVEEIVASAMQHKSKTRESRQSAQVHVFLVWFTVYKLYGFVSVDHFFHVYNH